MVRTPLNLLASLGELSFNRSMARQFWGPLVFFLLLFVSLVFVCMVFRDDVCNQEEYRVTGDRIRIYSPPPWIDPSFVDEALRLLPAEYREEMQNAAFRRENANSEKLSENLEEAEREEKLVELRSDPSEDDLALFESDSLKLNLNSNDPRLVENLRIAFQKHPLVESVKSIEIEYPALVKVRLVFRVPTAVVDPSPELRQEFLNDLSRDFSDDYGFFLEQEKIRRTRDPDAAQNEKKETANTGGRFLIDRTGLRLPTRYFRRCPDSYEGLPVIVGLNNSSASANSDQLLKESSMIARFFQEVDPDSNLQIMKFGVLRVYNSEHGIWFFKTRSGAMVKWGRFVRKAPPETTGTATQFAVSNPNDDWEELKNFQKGKLERFLLLVSANDDAVEKARQSDNEEVRNSAERLRVKVFDVSSELLGEEDESE